MLALTSQQCSTKMKDDQKQVLYHKSQKKEHRIFIEVLQSLIL